MHKQRSSDGRTESDDTDRLYAIRPQPVGSSNVKFRPRPVVGPEAKHSKPRRSASHR